MEKGVWLEHLRLVAPNCCTALYVQCTVFGGGVQYNRAQLLLSLSVSLFVSFSLFVTLCSSLCITFCLSLSLSLFVSLFLSFFLFPFSLFLCLSLSLSVSLCLSLSLSLSLCLSLSLSLSLSSLSYFPLLSSPFSGGPSAIRLEIASMSKLSRPSTISPLLKTAGLNSIRLELKKPVVAQVGWL